MLCVILTFAGFDPYKICCIRDVGLNPAWITSQKMERVILPRCSFFPRSPSVCGRICSSIYRVLKAGAQV